MDKKPVHMPRITRVRITPAKTSSHIPAQTLMTSSAPTPAPTPAHAPAPTPAPTPAPIITNDHPVRVDSDFDIEAVARAVMLPLTVVRKADQIVFNDTSILLQCDAAYPHMHYYLFKSIAPGLTCTTCSANRKMSTLRAVFEQYFSAPFIMTFADTLYCMQHRIRVSTADDKGPHVVITASTSTLPTEITVRKPYSRVSITAALKRAAADNVAAFGESAAAIVESKRQVTFAKSVPVKTRALVTARTGNRFLAAFDDSTVCDEEARGLCIENCYISLH